MKSIVFAVFAMSLSAVSGAFAYQVGPAADVIRTIPATGGTAYGGLDFTFSGKTYVEHHNIYVSGGEMPNWVQNVQVDVTYPDYTIGAKDPPQARSTVTFYDTIGSLQNAKRNIKLLDDCKYGFGVRLSAWANKTEETHSYTITITDHTTAEFGSISIDERKAYCFRFDISAGKISATATISSIDICGPDRLAAGDDAEYSCVINTSDGFTKKVEPKWSLASGTAYAVLGADGMLSVSERARSDSVVLQATCELNGKSSTGRRLIAVKPFVPEVETLEIIGDDEIESGDDAVYRCRVNMNDGKSFETDEVVWDIPSDVLHATIDAESGRLGTIATIGNTNVTLRALYSRGGKTLFADKNVPIKGSVNGILKTLNNHTLWSFSQDDLWIDAKGGELWDQLLGNPYIGLLFEEEILEQYFSGFYWDDFVPSIDMPQFAQCEFFHNPTPRLAMLKWLRFDVGANPTLEPRTGKVIVNYGEFSSMVLLHQGGKEEAVSVQIYGGDELPSSGTNEYRCVALLSDGRHKVVSATWEVIDGLDVVSSGNSHGRMIAAATAVERRATIKSLATINGKQYVATKTIKVLAAPEEEKPLKAPGDLKATCVAGGIELSWAETDDAAVLYYIYRSKNAEVGDDDILDIVDGTSYVDRTVENGKEYRYWVRAARNMYSVGHFSPMVSIVNIAPPIMQYKLTIKLGANIAKVYYKINGSSAWASSIKSTTLLIDEGSVWYGYAVATSGYVAMWGDKNNPYVDTKKGKAETFIFNAIAKTCKVTLDGQGATSMGTTSIKVAYGEALPQIEVPTKVGYTFGGYFTEPNGKGTKYYYSSGKGAKKWDKVENTTLYAKWTPIKYTITFNRQGATVKGTDSVTAIYGEALPQIEVPTKVGYTFGGYFTEPNGKGVKYYYSSGRGAVKWDKLKGATLYARWTTAKYTVTLNGQGATTAGTASVKVAFGNALPQIEVPIKTGYAFGGYFAEPNGKGTKYYYSSGKGAVKWDKTENTTLYAKWAPIKYKITFNRQGATVIASAAIIIITFFIVFKILV